MSLRSVALLSLHLTLAYANFTTVDDFCCSLCSCEDGCTDCDPYVDEAKGINCPTGGCDSNASPLACNPKICKAGKQSAVDTTIVAPNKKTATKASKINSFANEPVVDGFCCSLCSCDDGCTDCDPYVDEAKGIDCPTGGCDSNASPLACNPKVCKAGKHFLTVDTPIVVAPNKKTATKAEKINAFANVTIVGEFCCSLCSCDDGCTDCDPYVDEARGINCPTGGCDSNASPLTCNSKICTAGKHVLTVETLAAAPNKNTATKASKINHFANETVVDEFCCSLCSCEDGCTDCDPYVDEAKGINCPTGGCDANVRPLSCNTKVCPAGRKAHSELHVVV